MKHFFLFLIVGISFSCKEKKIQVPEIWETPIVIDTLTLENKFFRTKKIKTPINELIYIGQELDTIKIAENNLDYKQFYFESHISNDSANLQHAIEIIPDLEQNLTINESNFSIPPPPILIDGKEFEIDETKTDSLYNIWKTRKGNYIKAFPVFIRNISNDSIQIDHQDGQVFVIQEAKDNDGIWHPIEYWRFSDCGNSYAKSVIGPNELIIIKKIKYKGTFQTELRLKLKTENNIIYSRAFKGSINKEQFDVLNIDSWSKRKIDDKEYLDRILLNK
tara:strand:- start:94 stop:924 length:831 start_codon:yes stop_codon:yes gene_type:complete